MSFIMIQSRKKASGYIVPDGGEILWYGIASSVPSGWAIDAAVKNNFIEGAKEGEASDVSVGSNSHEHTMPNTSLAPDHGHSRGGFTTATYSSTQEEFQTSGRPNVAIPNHAHDADAGVVVADGEHDHTIPVTSNVDSYPPYNKRYYIIIASGDQPVPIGGIIFWDKEIEFIPAEFNLCDGEIYNSIQTPDLRKYFIYGANIDGDIDLYSYDTSHSHDLEDVAAGGAHDHDAGGSTFSCDQKSGGWEGVQVQSIHAHGLSGTTESELDHDHIFETSTQDVSHLPLFIKLFMIMRTV